VFGEYVDAAKLYAAFKVAKAPPKANAIHTIQPYVPKQSALSMSRIGRWFAIPALLVALGIFAFGGGTRVLSAPFSIAQSNSMMAMQLASNQSNAWAWYDITLLKGSKGDESIARLGKQVSYYSGVEGGESWSEGSRSERLLQTRRCWHLSILYQRYRWHRQAPRSAAKQTVEDDAGRGRHRFTLFFMLALLCVLAAIAEPLLRYRFERKRWAPVLEEGDDDE
jgi:hypothetical protein